MTRQRSFRARERQRRPRGWSTVLVTGASSGIGREIARQAAERGADVVAVARRRDELERLSQEVGERHARDVEILVADLTVPENLARIEERVADPVRTVDLLVNNAGFGSVGPFAELSVDREETEVRLNVVALQGLSHAALRTMLPRGRGGLLNVSSVAGFQALPGNATYGATKAFVTSFSEALHAEVRGRGVHVTVLCPGFIRTEFQGRAGTTERGLPEGVWMSAESIARAGLDAVTRNDAVCVPGLGYKLLVAGADVVPRPVLRRVTTLLSTRFAAR